MAPTMSVGRETDSLCETRAQIADKHMYTRHTVYCIIVGNKKFPNSAVPNVGNLAMQSAILGVSVAGIMTDQTTAASLRSRTALSMHMCLYILMVHML